jgi:hypothetical protein
MSIYSDPGQTASFIALLAAAGCFAAAGWLMHTAHRG